MESLVRLKNVKKYFLSRGHSKDGKWIKAVDGVNTEIKRGEILGLVGESGCGKTTLGNLILGFYLPTSGDILFENKAINKLNKSNLKAIRKKMSIIFQDPYSSLNPKSTIFNIVKEPLTESPSEQNKSNLIENVTSHLENVGISSEHLFRFPHEFSGGQRQRIAIARAIINRPSFIVLDEPTSGLDVSVQAQILNLLKELKDKFKITYLFISHNMGVIKYISTYIAVMYLGKIVETASKEDLFNNPLHPYTKLLLSVVPDMNIKKKKSERVLPTSIFDTIEGISGCNFYPRCIYKKKSCKDIPPEEVKVGKEHYVYCNNV